MSHTPQRSRPPGGRPLGLSRQRPISSQGATSATTSVAMRPLRLEPAGAHANPVEPWWLFPVWRNLSHCLRGPSGSGRDTAAAYTGPWDGPIELRLGRERRASRDAVLIVATE